MRAFKHVLGQAIRVERSMCAQHTHIVGQLWLRGRRGLLPGLPLGPTHDSDSLPLASDVPCHSEAPELFVLLCLFLFPFSQGALSKGAPAVWVGWGEIHACVLRLCANDQRQSRELQAVPRYSVGVSRGLVRRATRLILRNLQPCFVYQDWDLFMGPVPGMACDEFTYI